MPAQSPAQAFAASQAMDIKTGKKSPSDTTKGAVAMSKMPIDKLKHFMKMKECMTMEQKQRLLKVLKSIREEYTGNVGGETDIRNPDNLMVAEDEYTGTGAVIPEQNVIAKVFDTKGDFDSYVNQRRGIEMTPKERQSLVREQAPVSARPSAPAVPSNQPAESPSEETVDDKIRIQKTNTFVDETDGAKILGDFLAKLELLNQKPIQQDKFSAKYEVTDDFGNNDTTVIKKLKEPESGQFQWVAFSKHETPEEKETPEGSEETEEEPSSPELKEI